MVEQDEKIFSDISIKLKDLENDLKKTEKFIYELETEYLNTTSNSGNIIRGWDHIFNNKLKLTGNQYISNMTKKVKITNAERVFSMTTKGILEFDYITNIKQSGIGNISEGNTKIMKIVGNNNGNINGFVNKKKKMISLNNKRKVEREGK